MNEYFATLPDEQLCAELQRKIDDYYSWILNTGRLARWRIAYNTYYGQRGSHNSSHIESGGEKRELSFLMSNEYRSLVQHIYIMATQSRPSLDFVAENTDSTSKAQTFLAKGIVNYYRRDCGIDQNTDLATEIALVMDTAWVFNEFDYQLGLDVRPDMSGGMLKTGDIYSNARTPLEVIVDVTKPYGGKNQWVIVKDSKNKYDLAATYPDKASEILSVQRDQAKDALYRFGDSAYLTDLSSSSEVDVYTFYHAKTPALPQGKMFQFLSPKVFLGSSIALPYRKLPGNRVCPSEMILSPLGYSNSNDLLSLQDTMDALISAAVTNMTNCGVNNIWSKPGGDFDFEQLASGMNHIESEEKPEVLILNRLPPEWFNLANFVIARMEAISGVNSIARGNTQGKDFSGAAMALLQSMAIQFNSGVQKARTKLIEDNGNDVIYLTQDFVKEPMLATISGIKNAYMVKKYTGKDLNLIKRVYCRQGNAMQDTTAGQWEIAKECVQMGAITTVTDLKSVINEGNFDSIIERERNRSLTIDQENDALVLGEPVIASVLDNPLEHIQKHACVMDSPDSRKDPKLVERTQAHIEDHLQKWQSLSENPALLAVLGYPPYPVPQMPPMPGQAMPGLPMPPQEGQPSGPNIPQGPMPSEKEPSPVPGGPQMPINPLSKKKWNPQDGGLNS